MGIIPTLALKAKTWILMPGKVGIGSRTSLRVALILECYSAVLLLTIPFGGQ